MMNRAKLAFGAALLASGLIACSHQEVAKTTDTCAGIDWWEVGRTDGVVGQPASRLDDHKRRCNVGDSPVDVDLYLNGRDAGLVDFCTPQQGFAAGHSGGSYENVCPANLEPAFLKAFDTGKKLAALESQDADLESRIANLMRLIESPQGGPAMRSQLEQLKGKRAAVATEISKLEQTSSTVQ